MQHEQEEVNVNAWWRILTCVGSVEFCRFIVI
jgi:hypothetical protein